MLFSEILYLYDCDEGGNAKTAGVCKVSMQAGRLTAQLDLKPQEPFEFDMDEPYALFQLGGKQFCTNKMVIKQNKEIEHASIEVKKDLEAKQENITEISEKETKKQHNPQIRDLFALKQIHPEWDGYRQNTFLLHGFYNYGHVWATEEILGVPGNYYEREKQVAKMFGFHDFVLVKDMEHAMKKGDLKPNDGDYGYYILRATES